MRSRYININNLFVLLTIVAASWITIHLIKPALHYSFQETAFLAGSDFFLSFTDYPGGIADYIAIFISQFFLFNSFGSYLIVGFASLIGIISIIILNKISSSNNLRYTIFTIFLLVGIVILCDYRYPYYASIRLLLAVIFVCGYEYSRIKFQNKSILVWLVLAILLFYVASGAALFVFTLTTVQFILLDNNIKFRLPIAIFLLFFASVLPFIAYKFVFLTNFESLYNITDERPLAMATYKPDLILYIYYALLPTLLAISIVVTKIKLANLVNNLNKFISKNKFLRHPAIGLSVQLIGCLLIGYITFKQYYNHQEKEIMQVEYFAQNGRWSEVLQSTRKIEHHDFRVNFQVNRALSHLGKLPDMLFKYPQLLGSHGLFYSPSVAQGFPMEMSDLYYDLGLMSESQHWAFEAQTLMPNSPRVLKRLIMIYLVNKNYVLAEKFLTVLDKNMLYHKWVKKYTNLVNDTTLTYLDEEITEKRLFNPQKTALNSTNLGCLKLLTEANRSNRKAYDYLIAHCILDLNFIDFIDNLQYCNLYSINTLEKSWEEALIIYTEKTKKTPSFVKPEFMTKNGLQRLQNFNNTIAQFNNDIRAAKSNLFTGFNDTYWFYILYLSPKAATGLTFNTINK